MIIIDCEQGTEQWHGFRAGLPTASNFSKLITSQGKRSKQLDDYAAVLAADAYAGEPLDRWDGNIWTDRGKELEEQARAWYAFQTDRDVLQVGLVTDDDSRYGCSPDGLIGDDGCVEFKCQGAKGHTLTLMYFKKHGRIPPDYVAQVQGEMLVCERDWNDLVFFHPNLPSLIIRQYPNAEFRAALMSAVNEVIELRDNILSILKEY